MMLLESIKLFADLTPADFEFLREQIREISYAANQTIYHQGDASEGIYFVKSGLVTISAVVSPGDVRTLWRLGPGEMFGEMAFYENKPRSATATAEEPTTVYLMDRVVLRSALERMPKLSSALALEIRQRLRDLTQKYIHEASL